MVRLPLLFKTCTFTTRLQLKKIHRSSLGIFLLLYFFCCLPQTAVAAPPPVPDENIRINADHMSRNTAGGEYTAEGNVVVQWKGMNLVADKVLYSESTHMLHANGSVVLIKGAATLKGEKLVLDMDSGRAEMDSTLLSIPESSLKITSEKLVRLSESEFTATTTELTSCDLPDPSWKFGSENLRVNLLGYATGRNVIFYVKNVPVLYLPWVAFPVVLEKRSGLLFPRFSKSTRRGVQLDIPLYLVISPSHDLQVDVDIMSRRGVGIGLADRYIRTRGSEGHIGTYTIYDNLEERWRWQLAQEHTEIFSRDANLRMTVNATGDRTFLTDYGEKSGDYNRQTNDSVINTLKTWQNYAVTAYARYNVDLYTPDNTATLQTLPSIGVSGVRQPLFSLPLYLDLDASADNLYRESGTRGQRVYLFPRITLLPFRGNALQTTLFAGAHIRGYATDNRDSGTSSRAADLLPEAGARVSTSLTRIYQPHLSSLDKIRHEIIPEISYRVVPERDQQRLPFYEYTDRMIHRNMLTLATTSLLNGKFAAGDATEYRDISRLKISIDYAFEGNRRDLLTLVESQRPWSDLMLESDTWLSRQVRLQFDARYNLYESHLSTVATGIEVDDRRGNSLSAGYQMAQGEVEYFEGRVSTKMIQPLNLSYTARYSFDRSAFLETVYTAEYRHKCWSVNLAVHQRPGNQSYTVNFNLAGVGSK